MCTVFFGVCFVVENEWCTNHWNFQTELRNVSQYISKCFLGGVVKIKKYKHWIFFFPSRKISYQNAFLSKGNQHTSKICVRTSFRECLTHPWAELLMPFCCLIIIWKSDTLSVLTSVSVHLNMAHETDQGVSIGLLWIALCWAFLAIFPYLLQTRFLYFCQVMHTFVDTAQPNLDKLPDQS